MQVQVPLKLEQFTKLGPVREQLMKLETMKKKIRISPSNQKRFTKLGTVHKHRNRLQNQKQFVKFETANRNRNSSQN